MTSFIVVPKRAVVRASGSGAPSRQRRAEGNRLRRAEHLDLLRDTLADRGRADAMISMAGDRSGVPLEGSAGSNINVPLSLDALGLIIVRNPTSTELEALRAAGADILENVEVTGSAPIGRTEPTSSEPSESDLWHLDRIGARAMHASGYTGKGVLLGVLDSGVQANHPDLEGRVKHYMSFNRDGSFGNSLWKDFGSHGTHVCGTIAGRRCGVAPGAALAVAAALTVPQSNGMGGTLAQVSAAFNWLVQTDFPDGDMIALNASLGSNGFNRDFYDLIEDARSGADVLVVAAMGNRGPSNGRHDSPGNYDIVLGVGATDRNDHMAAFSGRGAVTQHPGLSKPDVCAPGVSIHSSVPTGRYAAMDGTSMASPCVTGACALLVERDPGLRSSPDALETAIKSQVGPLAPQPILGLGVLRLS